MEQRVAKSSTAPQMAEAVQNLTHPGLMLILTVAAALASSRPSRKLAIATHHDTSGRQTNVIKAQ